MISDSQILLGKGYLEGRQLPPREIAGLLHDVGFRGEKLLIMLATILSESQGYDRARHDNTDDNDKIISRDCGLGQINISAKVVGGKYEQQLYDPEFNVKVCWEYYEDRGFKPWHGYTRGYATDPEAKGRYIHRAILGVANYWAEKYGVEPVPFADERPDRKSSILVPRMDLELEPPPQEEE